MEQLESKYKAVFERKINDLKRKLEDYKTREKELKLDITLLKKREKELEKEIEKYRSKEKELLELEEKINKEREEIAKLEEEINARSKLLEEMENREREIIYRENELRKKEKQLREKERELTDRERELRDMLIRSSLQETTLPIVKETKKLEQETKESKDLSEMEIPAALVRKGMILKANEQFLSLTGLSERDITNKSFFSLIAPEELPNLQRYYLSRLKGADIDSIDTIIVNSKNEKIPVKIKLNQIKSRDGIFDLALIESLD